MTRQLEQVREIAEEMRRCAKRAGRTPKTWIKIWADALESLSLSVEQPGEWEPVSDQEFHCASERIRQAVEFSAYCEVFGDEPRTELGQRAAAWMHGYGYRLFKRVPPTPPAQPSKPEEK